MNLIAPILPDSTDFFEDFEDNLIHFYKILFIKVSSALQMKMRRLSSISRRKKHFVITLIICVAIVRALVVSLQPDEEDDTDDDNFKSRVGKQIASRTQGGRTHSANKKEGTGTKRPGGYSVEGGHHTRSNGKGNAGNKLPPANQKGNERKEDVQARDNGPKSQMEDVNMGTFKESGKAKEEYDRHYLVAMTTDSTYTVDGGIESASNESNSYFLSEELSPEQMMQDGFLRIVFVENRYRGIHGHRFQELLGSERCPCELGTNRSRVIVTTEDDVTNLGDYDVLIFVQDIAQKPLTPSVWKHIVLSAKEGQKRVYASIQSVLKIRYLIPSVPKSNSPFHWSLTYHSKSDIPMPYGRYQPFDYGLETDNSDRNWAEGKTGLVAWISSGMNTMLKRKEFVSSLQAYFQVDLLTCNADSDSCKENIRNYKFYLAIENSCCSEYITEELWRSFSWGVVPIVIGAPKEDYLRLAPPNSIIYADDFETPEDLGDYLRKLDNTDEFYNDYFQWRQEGKVFLGPSMKESSGEELDTSLYSCKTVCQVATKYVNETPTVEKGTDPGNYFDPGVSWWGKSCTACSSHTWISKFNLQGVK